MTIEQDERFKAAAHGLLLGCVLPIMGYNIAAGKKRNLVNTVVYGAFIAFEIWHIVGHMRAYQDEENHVQVQS